MRLGVFASSYWHVYDGAQRRFYSAWKFMLSAARAGGGSCARTRFCSRGFAHGDCSLSGDSRCWGCFGIFYGGRPDQTPWLSFHRLAELLDILAGRSEIGDCILQFVRGTAQVSQCHLDVVVLSEAGADFFDISQRVGKRAIGRGEI